MLKVAALLLGLSLLPLSAAEKKTEFRPQTQAHTEKRAVFARASLNATKGNEITGNVEFMEKNGRDMVVLAVLANGPRGKQVPLSLFGMRKCPNGEGGKEKETVVDAKEVPLGKIKITKNGLGTASFPIEMEKSKILQQAVVAKTDQGAWAACGIVQPEGLTRDKAE